MADTEQAAPRSAPGRAPSLTHHTLHAGGPPLAYAAHAAWMPMRVSALHFAALRGDRSAIDYLLSRGADTALRDQQYSATPDGWAEYNGHPELANLIRAHARAKGDFT